MNAFINNSKPNKEQRRIAAFLGVDVSKDSAAVAAARLQGAVAGPLHLSQAKLRPTKRQATQAKELGLDITGDTQPMAAARINEELHQRNAQALERLKLKPGDWVRREVLIEGRGPLRVMVIEGEVERISANLRVHLKGRHGGGLLPGELIKIERG